MKQPDQYNYYENHKESPQAQSKFTENACLQSVFFIQNLTWHLRLFHTISAGCFIKYNYYAIIVSQIDYVLQNIDSNYLQNSRVA